MASLTIPAFISNRFVQTIEAAGDRRKVFQVFFGKRDGSLFVAFPYYRYSSGLLAIATLKANQFGPTSVSLVERGKVTGHRVKYSHHPDGACHFSQDGKIISSVRKQSVRHDQAKGHVFSVQLQGLHDFSKLRAKERAPMLSESKTIINWKFDGTAPAAYKFVGLLYMVADLGSMTRKMGTKPWVEIKRPDGSKVIGAILAGPQASPAARYCLVLTCEGIPRLDADKSSTLTFAGGFDPREVALNHKNDTSFLALAYPTLDEYQELLQKIGTVDLAESTLRSATDGVVDSKD